MIKTHKGPISAAELSEQLQNDPVFQKSKKIKEKLRSERALKLRLEQEDILIELRDVGIKVNSVWDLISQKSYIAALPILIRHLKRPYSGVLREGLARALAVREAAPFWSDIVDVYVNAPMGEGYNSDALLKDALAVAVAASAPNSQLDQLIHLAKNPTLGPSRVMLLRRLKRSKLPSVRAALLQMKADPDLTQELKSFG